MRQGLNPFKNYRFTIPSFRIRSIQVLQVYTPFIQDQIPLRITSLQSLHLGLDPFKDYRFRILELQVYNPLFAYERIQELEVYNPFIVHEGIGSSQEFRVYNSFIVMEGVDPLIKLPLFNIIKNPEKDPPPTAANWGEGGTIYNPFFCL